MSSSDTKKTGNSQSESSIPFECFEGGSLSEPFIPYEFVEDGKVVKVLGSMKVKRVEEMLDVILQRDKEDELIEELQARAKDTSKKQITPLKPGSTVDYESPIKDGSWHGGPRS